MRTVDLVYRLNPFWMVRPIHGATPKPASRRFTHSDPPMRPGQSHGYRQKRDDEWGWDESF